MATKSYLFKLQLSAEEFLAYYQGVANSVVVRDDNGQTIQFPAAVLRAHLTQTGIRGRFRLTIDANNRFQSIEHLGDL